MKRVLIYSNRKIDNIVFDISTPAKKQKAMMKLFKMLDRDWNVYCDLKLPATPATRPCSHCGGTGMQKEDESYLKTEQRHREWYRRAKKGDMNALERLLTSRVDYEYEGWSITTL